MPQTRKFWPPKYYASLSKTKKAERKKEILKFGSLNWKDSKAYVGFKTNIGRKTRKSSYTAQWNKLFPDAKSLEEKAKATGVPLKFIKESYNRGLAAWRTGHRPGATQQQWGYARVHSLLCFGKTALTTDSDIIRRAKAESKTAKRWFNSVEKKDLCGLK